MQEDLLHGLLFTLRIDRFTAAEPLCSRRVRRGRSAIHSKHVLDVRSGTAERGMGRRARRPHRLDRKSPPSGREVIELGDATVLPGLIDCHVHLDARLERLLGDVESAPVVAEKTLIGLMNAETYLQHGFTTCATPVKTIPATTGRAARRVRQGDVPPDRGSSSPASRISVTGGHADLNPLAPDVPMREASRTSPTRSTKREGAVRHDLRNGVDWIKLMATGGVADALSDYNVQELSDEQMKAAVEVGTPRRPEGHGARGRNGRDQRRRARRRRLDRARHGARRGDGEADGRTRHVARADARRRSSAAWRSDCRPGRSRSCWMGSKPSSRPPRTSCSAIAISASAAAWRS